MNEIILRDAVNADLPFIFNSWLENYFHNSFLSRNIQKPTFMKYHSVILNMMVERPTCIVRIASTDDFTILGYIVAENPEGEHPIIHYCFVRPEFHRLGLARKMFESLNFKGRPVECSHWTPVLNEINRIHRIFTYVPYRM